MKKLNKRSKKIMMVTGIAAVCCAGVLAAVMVQANAQPNEDAPTPVSSNTSSVQLILSSGLNITAPESKSGRTGSAASTGAFVPEKGKNISEPLTSSVQKDQAPVPPKPSVASSADTQKVLTDRTKKPTYKTPPKTTTTTGDSTKKKSPSKKSSTPKKNTVSQPSKTGNHAGEAYDPVFGWTKSTGGEGTTVGNPGDELTGNKVGIMD
jgi:hypothetical protein